MGLVSKDFFSSIYHVSFNTGAYTIIIADTQPLKNSFGYSDLAIHVAKLIYGKQMENTCLVTHIASPLTQSSAHTTRD